MKKYPELNRIGVFRKLRTDDWLTYHHANGKPYLDGSILRTASLLEPLYGYGHNYTVDGTEVSLFMWTDESDIAKIGKFFEDTINGLGPDKLAERMGSKEGDRFIYLNERYVRDK